jgi:hypothetical protein
MNITKSLYKKRINFIKLILFFFLLAIFTENTYCQKNKEQNKSNVLAPLKIYIAGIDIGKELKGLNPTKVEASFAFTMLMAKYFDIVPIKSADSVSKLLKAEGKPNTILDVAKYFKAHFIVYINLNRFVDVMRCDVTLLSGKDYTSKNTGTGYAYINFRDSIDTKFLYDPSITLSIQRAFAVAVKDSSLFADAPKPVFPVKTCVTTGIEFKNNNDLPRWSLFEEEVVNSFYLCETIFQEAAKSNKYILFDLDTRDSIYSTFKFYAPENYKAPNQMELYALRQFEIQTFITGTFQRDTSGATLTLILAQFTNEGLNELNRVSGNILTDSKVDFEKLIIDLTDKLLKINN